MREIRWGILGTGGVAAGFANDLGRVPGARLTAVASRTQEHATAFANAFGAARAYHAYEDLATDPEIDVVYIATPNHLHREHCLLCLDCGKAVLCEKPFAVTAAEAREVIARAREKRLFCMEAMWMRFVPVMRELLALLASGVIGELRMATIQLGFSNMVNPKRGVFNPGGGGVLLDLGVYPLSLATQIFGAPTHVESQVVFGATGVDEQVSALLAYAGGQQAVITASLRNETANDAVIMGSHGYVRVLPPLYSPTTLTITKAPPFDVPATVGRPKRSWLRALYAQLKPYVPLRRPGQTSRLIRSVHGAGYWHEASEVMRCLRAGELESPIMSLDETARVLDIVETIRQQWTVISAGAERM